jgi:hypothetical protein
MNKPRRLTSGAFFSFFLYNQSRNGQPVPIDRIDALDLTPICYPMKEDMLMDARFTTRQYASAVFLFPLNLIASILDLVFCIPWLGRFLKYLWNSLLTLLHFVVGMVENLAWSLGCRPVKKMKVGVVLLSDEDGNPVEELDKVVAALDKTTEIYYRQARIKLLPAAHIPKGLANQDLPSSYWITVADHPTSRRLLKVGCDGRAILNDLGMIGASYQWIHLKRYFFTSFRRVFGYGAPVTIFIVREIQDKVGCSLGWFTDYVTIQAKHLKAIPHELGHACNLFHSDNKKNLMYKTAPVDPELTTLQIALMRASRHVTIL